MIHVAIPRANIPGGAAPETKSSLPVERSERKSIPIATGCLDYFPMALAEVARVSQVANEQHNPGQAMRWAREKSSDHADCLLRHLVDRGKVDTDNLLHSAKVAWRALALLQLELEQAARVGSAAADREAAIAKVREAQRAEARRANQPDPCPPPTTDPCPPPTWPMREEYRIPGYWTPEMR